MAPRSASVINLDRKLVKTANAAETIEESSEVRGSSLASSDLNHPVTDVSDSVFLNRIIPL